MRQLLPVAAISLVAGALAVYIPFSVAVERQAVDLMESGHLIGLPTIVSQNSNFWLGTAIWKNPLDAWIYQEIITELKPDILIETGTYRGGAALYYATLFDELGKGRVISVDIENFDPPSHPRVTYLIGSSTDSAIVARIQAMVRPEETVMVTLDSDHADEHVRRELEAYGPLVTPGSYLVVEDTNVCMYFDLDGGDRYSQEAGPARAVEAFLRLHPEFVPDRTREKFRLTNNPGGWLRREAIR